MGRGVVSGTCGCDGFKYCYYVSIATLGKCSLFLDEKDWALSLQRPPLPPFKAPYKLSTLIHVRMCSTGVTRRAYHGVEVGFELRAEKSHGL